MIKDIYLGTLTKCDDEHSFNGHKFDVLCSIIDCEDLMYEIAYECDNPKHCEPHVYYMTRSKVDLVKLIKKRIRYISRRNDSEQLEHLLANLVDKPCGDYVLLTWFCEPVDFGDYHKALKLATKAHMGQVDKVSMPYIEHVKTVSKFAKTKKGKILGLLHDVVEDSVTTLEDLDKAGFSEDIVFAVDCLTKREGESIEDYFARVAKSKRVCINCGGHMKQQFIGLKHCKCGISWKKDEGYFERTPDMIFALERQKVGGKIKQVPIVRCKND